MQTRLQFLPRCSIFFRCDLKVPKNRVLWPLAYDDRWRPKKKSVIKVRIGKRIWNTSTNDLFYFCEFCNMKIILSKIGNRTKKVLILSSSPRRGGNSDTLCEEFMRGAAEAGNEVKISE